MQPGDREKNGPLKALVRGKLIDGTGGPPIEDAVVVVEGDRIRGVGQADQVSVPPGAEVIDLTGKTVMPGLINCHTHLCLDGSPDPVTALKQRSFTENVLIAAKHAEAALRAGVTAVRDLGGGRALIWDSKRPSMTA